MLSPCVKCGPLKCVLGQRKKDCLAPYSNLRRIGNSEGGFASANENPEDWPEFERSFYYKQTEGITSMSEEAEIEDGVAMPSEPAAPVEPPKRRGRKPGSANKPKTPSQAEMLEAALEFVAPVESSLQEFAAFVDLTENMATMTNGQMAAGHPIVEELTLCPHLGKLRASLKRCGKTLVITETENRQLSIKGDKLRALVPCWHGELPPATPDAPAIEGDFDILKEAFRVCGTLASENGDRVVEASLLLEPNACTGTNGAAILQFWHGIPSLPPGTVIPKAFAAAIAANKKKITGLGANWNAEGGFASSVTFWFEGGAWLKTQCYNDRWPSLAPILDVPSSPVATPEGLFEAIDAIKHFLDDGKLSAMHFVDGFVQSHAEKTVGAQYEVKGLPGGKVFNGKLLAQIGPWAKSIDLTTHNDRAFFFGGDGNNVRGAVMCMRMQ